MKAIFLDIDGVLNSHQWVMAGNKYGHGPSDAETPTPAMLNWDPSAVANLRHIIDNTLATIVISSSWRGYGLKAVEVWRRMFACYGWDDAPVIGETPDLNRLENGIYVSRIRGDEVAEFLRQNPVVTSYICIDDDSDFRPDQPLVKTDNRFGLTLIDAKKAIRLLNAPAPTTEAPQAAPCSSDNPATQPLALP